MACERAGLCLRHRDIEIEISEAGHALRHKAFPGQLQHGGDHAPVGDVAGADLAVYHHAARGSEIHIGASPWMTIEARTLYRQCWRARKPELKMSHSRALPGRD